MNKKRGVIAVFYDRFVELCKIKKMSPAAVAKDIGLSNSSTTTWKNGSIPKGDTLQKLADYFGVSVDYLLGRYQLKRIFETGPDDVQILIFSELKRKGIPYEDFCINLGLPFDEWFHWKEGSSESYLDCLPQIAKLLNIPENELNAFMGGYRKRTVSVETQLRKALIKLNDEGKQEAVKRVEELTEIPRYQRQAAPESKDTPTTDSQETPPEDE